MLNTDLSLSSTGDILLENEDISLIYDNELAVQLFMLSFRSRPGDLKLFPELGMGLSEFTSKTNSRENADDIKSRIEGKIDDIPFFDDYALFVDAYPTDVNDLRLDINLRDQNDVPLELPLGIDYNRGTFVGIDEFQFDEHSIYVNSTTIRTERIKIETSTKSFQLQFLPAPNVDGIYDIDIYTQDNFNPDDTESNLLEDISVPVDFTTTKQINFIGSNLYNTAQTNNITVLYINGFEVDAITLETNNWIYTVTDSELEAAIIEDDNIEVDAFYNNTIATGSLLESIPKSVTVSSIAPELEDSNKYSISSTRTLSPGIYYVIYNSYIVRS
jgi:hypothetical protein